MCSDECIVSEKHPTKEECLVDFSDAISRIFIIMVLIVNIPHLCLMHLSSGQVAYLILPLSLTHSTPAKASF